MPRWAARLVPIGGKLSTVARGGRDRGDLRRQSSRALIKILKTGALVAGVLLILGAFVVGFLLSRRERRAVLGLGTAQRNVAAALVLASRDFADSDVLVMVTACVLAGLFVLFPIAWLLGRQRRTSAFRRPKACPHKWLSGGPTSGAPDSCASTGAARPRRAAGASMGKVRTPAERKVLLLLPSQRKGSRSASPSA